MWFQLYSTFVSSLIHFSIIGFVVCYINRLPFGLPAQGGSVLPFSNSTHKGVARHVSWLRLTILLCFSLVHFMFGKRRVFKYVLWLRPWIYHLWQQWRRAGGILHWQHHQGNSGWSFLSPFSSPCSILVIYINTMICRGLSHLLLEQIPTQLLPKI